MLIAQVVAIGCNTYNVCQVLSKYNRIFDFDFMRLFSIHEIRIAQAMNKTTKHANTFCFYIMPNETGFIAIVLSKHKYTFALCTSAHLVAIYFSNASNDKRKVGLAKRKIDSH